MIRSHNISGFIKCFIVLVACFLLVQCASATPPVSIPAPTMANISATEDGQGNIYVRGVDGAVEADATVEVIEEPVTSFYFEKSLLTNVAWASSENVLCSTVADAAGAFACTFEDPGAVGFCIRQTSSGVQSDCETLSVTQGVLAHKLTQLLDITLDAFQGNTYLLGKDGNDDYKLLVFDNTNETFEAEIRFLDLFPDKTSATLVSVAAYNDQIAIADSNGGNIYRFDIQGQNPTTTVGVCQTPDLIRIKDTVNNDISSFLLACRGANDNSIVGQTIGGNQEGGDTLDNHSKISEATGLAQVDSSTWFSTLATTEGTTLLVRIAIGGIVAPVINLSESIYLGDVVTHSAGTMGNSFVMPVVKDATDPGYFAFIQGFSGFNFLVENDGVEVTDLACGSSANCDTLYLLSNADQKVYEVALAVDGSSSIQSEQTMEAFEASRILVDEAHSKLVVVDSAARTLFWLGYPF